MFILPKHSLKKSSVKANLRTHELKVFKYLMAHNVIYAHLWRMCSTLTQSMLLNITFYGYKLIIVILIINRFILQNLRL